MLPWPGTILNTGNTAQNLMCKSLILMGFTVGELSRNTAVNGTVAAKSFVAERFLRLKKKNHNIFACFWV